MGKEFEGSIMKKHCIKKRDGEKSRTQWTRDKTKQDFQKMYL